MLSIKLLRIRKRISRLMDQPSLKIHLQASDAMLRSRARGRGPDEKSRGKMVLSVSSGYIGLRLLYGGVDCIVQLGYSR